MCCGEVHIHRKERSGERRAGSQHKRGQPAQDRGQRNHHTDARHTGRIRAVSATITPSWWWASPGPGAPLSSKQAPGAPSVQQAPGAPSARQAPDAPSAQQAPAPKFSTKTTPFCTLDVPSVSDGPTGLKFTTTTTKKKRGTRRAHKTYLDNLVTTREAHVADGAAKLAPLLVHRPGVFQQCKPLATGVRRSVASRSTTIGRDSGGSSVPAE